MGPYTIPMQAITPLFLAGAEQRESTEMQAFARRLQAPTIRGGVRASSARRLQAPTIRGEIRASSVRGALRYWLRAGLGGVLGDQEQKLALLRQKESSVFGSASSDGEGGASSVVVRVLAHAQPLQPKPWGPTRRTPKDYLYWSMRESGDNNNYRAPHEYFEPPCSWLLQLAARPGARDADKLLEQALAALWLLVQLGGLGSRSRRTGGSLAAKEPQEALPETLRGLHFALRAQTADELSKELSDGLGVVRRAFQREIPESHMPQTPSAFDVLHPTTGTIWVLSADRSGNPWRSWDKAADAIGKALSDFRKHTNALERAAFGLPFPFGSVTPVNGQRFDRRASPLWLKVTQTDADRYFGVATLFRSQFLPQQACIQARDGRSVAPPADYLLIEQFLQQGEQFTATKVHYE